MKENSLEADVIEKKFVNFIRFANFAFIFLFYKK